MGFPFPSVRINKMPFKKFISIGSVAVLQDGPCKGKIAAIVDVIDQNRVLIDGPCSEVPRQAYRIKNLHLTPLTTKFQFSSKSRVVRKAWEEDKISQKWAESAWAKRMEARAARAAMTDLDRFKLARAKSTRNKILRKAANIQKKKLQKAGKL